MSTKAKKQEMPEFDSMDEDLVEDMLSVEEETSHPVISPASKKADVPQIKKILKSELDQMAETVREMQSTNVVSYPLKYVVLRKWFTSLWEVHDRIMLLIDEKYRRD